jgi:hypothetical protein
MNNHRSAKSLTSSLNHCSFQLQNTAREFIFLLKSGKSAIFKSKNIYTMSTGYQIKDQNGVCFLTFQVVN